MAFDRPVAMHGLHNGCRRHGRRVHGWCPNPAECGCSIGLGEQTHRAGEVPRHGECRVGDYWGGVCLQEKTRRVGLWKSACSRWGLGCRSPLWWNSGLPQSSLDLGPVCGISDARTDPFQFGGPWLVSKSVRTFESVLVPALNMPLRVEHAPSQREKITWNKVPKKTSWKPRLEVEKNPKKLGC